MRKKISSLVEGKIASGGVEIGKKINILGARIPFAVWIVVRRWSMVEMNNRGGKRGDEMSLGWKGVRVQDFNCISSVLRPGVVGWRLLVSHDAVEVILLLIQKKQLITSSSFNFASCLSPQCNF